MESEYQRKFTDSPRKEKFEAYKNMVALRQKRKFTEFRHTPIIWLEDKEINSISNSQVTKKEQRSVLRERNVNLNKELEPDTIISESHTITKDAEVQTPRKLWYNGQKRRSTPNKAVKRKIEYKSTFSGHSKPVIAYGWADKTSIWKKKTFNVKAPTSEVKCSALRAAKQRVNKLQFLSKQEKLEQEKVKTQMVIESLTQVKQWQTEYQKQFCKF